MSAWRTFVALCQVREPGAAMALVRVLTGVAVTRTVWAVVWAGAMRPVWNDAADGGIRDLGLGPTLFYALGGPTPGVVRLVTAGAMLGGILVALGVGGAVGARLVTFGTLQCFLAIADLNSHAGGSYDELLLNLMWLLVLCGPTGTMSVECRLRTGVWTDVAATTPLWARLLVVWQAVLMYGTTGLQKLSIHWLPGGDLGALYYILQQPTWQHRDHAWVAQFFPVTQLATFVSWFWEVTAPVWGLAVLATTPVFVDRGWAGALRRARVREAYWWVGVSFHLAVALLLDIGSFTWASLCLYPAFFTPSEAAWVTGGAKPTHQAAT